MTGRAAEKSPKMKTIFACLMLALTISAAEAVGRRHYSHSAGKHRTYVSHHRTSRYSAAAPRTNHGRVKRSARAKHEFIEKSGYPHGRPGYVIDHVVPLSRGGADSPGNMHWPTKADAKAKEKWERGPSRSAMKHTSNRRR